MAKTSAVGDVNGPESFQYDPSFEGPAKNRSCTDVLCFLIFLAFIIGWGVVGVFAWKYGNPDSLVYPTDSFGKMCGKDPEVADKPVLFFFDLTKCANPAVLVTGCPTPQVCVEKCPKESYVIGDFAQEKDKLICTNGINPQAASPAELEQHCAKYYLKSVNVLNRCVPDIKTNRTSGNVSLANTTTPASRASPVDMDDVAQGSRNMAKLMRFQQIGQRVFEDLRASWWAILIGLAVGALVAFIWIVLMQFIASIMVWLSMFAVLGLFSYGLYFSVKKYIDLKEHPGSSTSLADIGFTVDLDIYLHLRDTWLGFSIVIGSVLLILILIFLFLRDRILIAIELIREGSKAVSAVTSTLFYPAFTFLMQMVCFAVFVSMAIYLASIGKTSFRVVGLDRAFTTTGPAPDCEAACFGYQTNSTCIPKHFKECVCTPESNLEPKCIFFSYQDEYGLAKLQIYNIFAFLWTTFFVSAFGELVLAGAFSAWYWTFDKKKGAPSLALLSSFGRGLRYHVGTVAFGSFIIAVIRGIRLVLEYLDRKLKEYKDNPVTKCVMCCCKCFFWCLEKFMRFVNRNAYVVCAIHGKAFCPSAQTAFFLLLRNVARVVILDKVTDFLLFVGKLVVVGAVGLASFYVFSGQLPVEFISGSVPKTHYYHVPVILVTVGTYFVACAFFSVYEMAIDTMFICFLEDSERNDGSPQKPYFMSKSLMKILGKKNRRYENKE